MCWAFLQSHPFLVISRAEKPQDHLDLFIENVDRWPFGSDTVGFLSGTTSAESARGLNKVRGPFWPKLQPDISRMHYSEGSRYPVLLTVITVYGKYNVS